MSRSIRPQGLNEERGLTLIELLVALAVFALFVLMIDAVFLGANRSSRKTEVAADVQQNARIAVERVTREIRESSAGEIIYDETTIGRDWVLFKSARLRPDQDPTKFCLYVRTETEPLYDARCFDNVGAPKPPYGAPPYAAPCTASDGTPCRTYTPIWQRYVGYYVVDTSDGLELRRVAGNLTSPTQVLDSGWLTGGDVVASRVESFDVAVNGSDLSVRLHAQGTETVQGSPIPLQQILLPGRALLRN